MSSAWDPISLAFSNPELEDYYIQYLEASTFIAVDTASAYFGVVTNIALAWSCWQRKAIWGPIMTPAINVLCGLVVLLCSRGSRRSFYLKNRTTIILILRSVRFASGVSAYRFAPTSYSAWNHLLLVCFFGMFSAYWAVGMPLAVKVRLLHQPLSLRYAAGSCCTSSRRTGALFPTYSARKLWKESRAVAESVRGTQLQPYV